MANIRLEKIDYYNYSDVVKLQVDESQKNFVASNVYSLAEAYAAIASEGYALPFGIYADDEPVGFLMIGYYPHLEYARAAFGYYEEGTEIPEYIVRSYSIWRFMIDKEHQGKGYGREALKLAIEYIRTLPLGEAEYIWLDYEPSNEVARQLYLSSGFEEQPLPKGWDEIPAVMKL